jgi:hypothetical protein
MMKKITNTRVLLLLLAVSLLTACKKDFLSTIPLDQVQSAETWKDPALAEAFVNGIYNGIGQGGFRGNGEEMIAAFSDEAIFTHQGRGINTVNEGILNPSNPGLVSTPTEWAFLYNNIRRANLAMAGLPAATIDKELKDRLEGETRFLRAFFYHQLLRYHGGVPIITKFYNLNEDYTATRNTYAEVSNFILTQADTAYNLLKGKTRVKGRATDLAALALKSRQLLYDASDLHDMTTAKAKSTVIAAYQKPELLGFVSGDRRARWLAARDAAKAVLDAAGSGYKTNLAAPVTPEEGRKNYLSIAMGGASRHPDADPAVASTNELLFVRTFTLERVEDGMRIGLQNGPNGYNNWAGNTPIQQLVDDYEMMDGSRFSWDSAKHKADPYENRDPRFYASILYDGAPWKPRGRAEDPANEIQTGTYFVGNTKIVGLDTRQGPIENWNGSFTGYYVRKFIDPDPTIRDNTSPQVVPWPFFRYTEAMFNYAEALIELGDDAEARNWLNRIRFRAGMPAITEAGNALKQRFRNEKRIEMAYEEMRFHDTRRWMIAPETLGRKVKYIDIVGTLKPGAVAPTPYRKDKTKFNYVYTPIENNTLENRVWNDKMYYRPLTLGETQRNSGLTQNPGF